MKNVYIVDTPYHLLITLTKTFLAHREGKDDIIFVKKATSLHTRKNAQVYFQNVICSYNQYNVLLEILLMKIQQKKIPFISSIAKKRTSNMMNLFSNYSNIYIFDDNSFLGCWLNNAKIYYDHIEDGLNYLQWPLHKTKRMATYDFFYKILRISWKYWGESEYTKSIEVNDGKNLRITRNNIIVQNREQMFKQLTPEQKEAIARVFDYRPLNNIEPGEKTLLLTDPLYEDGVVSHEKKIQIYKYLVEKYAVGKLYIKQHPREIEDYSKIFPNAVILGNQKIPFEIYQLKEDFKFNKAIGAGTTVMDAVYCAEEKINVKTEWILNFH